MRFGIILLAFVFGCITTAFIRVYPHNASASDTETETVAESEFELTPTAQKQVPQTLDVVEEPFGETADGKSVKKFVCSNANGYVLEMIDYGASITALRVPSADNSGEAVNVVLSCSDMTSYEACTSYFGSTIGRYSNRIAKGKFSIDGKDYQVPTNTPPNCLHGGTTGFDKLMWTGETIKNQNSVGVRFALTSPDGDQGFPGEVVATAEYTLDNENQLKMVFSATSDATTHVNMCNHAYWNLAGAGSGSVMPHLLHMPCEEVLEFDDTDIPTGKMLPTKQDPFFDFTSERTIDEGIKALPEGATGYDHCYVVKRDSANELALLGSVRDPLSGRKMTVYTTQPGFQFYTSNHFNGQPQSGGFELFGAVCFETQGYPDTPNRPEFPTTLLKPGQKMVQTTVHKFSYEN